MTKPMLAMCSIVSIVLMGCHVTVQPQPPYPPVPVEQPRPEGDLQMSHDCRRHSNMPLIYCQRCGVMPGKVSNCPNYSSHDFASVPPGSAVVCRRCGVFATPEPTRCPSYSGHDFMLVKPGTALVCTRCGAAPTGKPVQCPGYSGHDFKVFK